MEQSSRSLRDRNCSDIRPSELVEMGASLCSCREQYCDRNVHHALCPVSAFRLRCRGLSRLPRPSRWHQLLAVSRDPEFLKSYEGRGQGIRLDEGERKRISVKVISSSVEQP